MSFNPEKRTQLLDTKSVRFRSAYSEKLSISLTFPENSEHTRQEFKDECDINNIMRQYEVTGEIFHLNEVAPQYLDCDGNDFRSAMDYVASAFSMFEELPSSIRSRFDNDPAEFLDFCSQEKNRPELADMGLLSSEALERFNNPPAPAPVPPVAPQAATPPVPAPKPDGA